MSVPVNDGLAQISDNLMVSATVVYALAMVGYLAEAAFGGRGRVSRALAASERDASEHVAEPVSVGAGASVPPTSAPPTSVAPDSDGAEPHPAQARPLRTPAERVGRSAVSLTVLGFALHLLGVLGRGVSAGRAPWGNMYEFSTAGALAAVGVFLFLLTRQRVRYLGGVLMIPVVLTMGTAVTLLYTESARLVPALDSYWLAIHVTAAVLCAGIFTVSTAATVLYLVAERYDRRTAASLPTSGVSAAVRRLAGPETLDGLAYRTVSFGFPLWTFAVVAGAIWAEAAWGRYWGWDPKETWAFITWVVYACYLHARATAGWRGRRAAVVALVAYGAFVFNYVGVNLFLNGLHSYAGV
ncbi:MAG: c-type cytochrome biogenesis protein CcsB [Actinomycetes bacterium]